MINLEQISTLTDVIQLREIGKYDDAITVLIKLNAKTPNDVNILSIL